MNKLIIMKQTSHDKHQNNMQIAININLTHSENEMTKEIHVFNSRE